VLRTFTLKDLLLLKNTGAVAPHNPNPNIQMEFCLSLLLLKNINVAIELQRHDPLKAPPPCPTITAKLFKFDTNIDQDPQVWES
jgi:hypothetical protein